MISSFEYVKYDTVAANAQNVLRSTFKELELEIKNDARRILLEEYLLKIFLMTHHLTYRELALNALTEAKSSADMGYKAPALLKLEEAYYWCGKFIRMDAILRLKGKTL